MIIGPAHPFRGGIAAFNDRLAIALQSAGHEVLVHTFRLQYPGLLFPGKTQFTEDPPPAGIQIERTINSVNPLNWFKIGRRIRKMQADLVLVRYWLPFMGPCLGTISRQIRRNQTSRIIAITDNVIPHEARPGDRLFTQYFVRSVDGFVVMSNTVLQDLAMFDTAKPRVLTPHPLYDHYGSPRPREEMVKKLGLDPEDRILLFFGLIRDYKGLDLLLNALTDPRIRRERIKLIIAGEYYTDKKTYDDFIKDKNLEGQVMQIDKYIPDNEVADYFSACDLVVQPYKSATQSGITQIAYHFNKPMVVTRVGGLAEMCPDGKVGYVVDPEPQAIASAILRFFQDTDIEAMIQCVQEEKKRFSWQILVDEILKVAAHA